ETAWLMRIRGRSRLRAWPYVDRAIGDFISIAPSCSKPHDCSRQALAPRAWRHMRVGVYDMVEMLFMAQLVRRPLQALARRWWCKGLLRATRGQRRCPECTKS